MEEEPERTPDGSDSDAEEVLGKPIPCSACGDLVASVKGLPKHWALVHSRTVRKFLCPSREDDFCLYATANDRNMRRHFTGKKHQGLVNGEKADAKVVCHRSLLKVGEYLNPSYRDPGDVPPPSGLVKYYLDAGLEPIDPKHKIDKCSLLLKSQTTMYEAAKELQITLEIAKEEVVGQVDMSSPEAGASPAMTQSIDGNDNKDLSVVRRTHTSDLSEALDEEMPLLEPVTPPELSPLQEKPEPISAIVQEYVVVQPSQEMQFGPESSNVTSIWRVESSEEEKFEDHLNFMEELCRRARKRKSSPDISADEGKIRRLEAEVAQLEVEKKHLYQLLKEKEEHIQSLRQALQQRPSESAGIVMREPQQLAATEELPLWGKIRKHLP